jgi:hypothetical protein
MMNLSEKGDRERETENREQDTFCGGGLQSKPALDIARPHPYTGVQSSRRVLEDGLETLP